MRFSILLAAVGVVFFHVSSARSQTDAGAALWDELNRSATAIENATPADCETACKALESMERAAQHICTVAPDHCDEAKARVAAARERVKSACPTCMTAPEE